MTNSQFAKKIGIRPESLHARICRYGSYFGVVPDKLPNGRLIWPDDAFERLPSQQEGGLK